MKKFLGKKPVMITFIAVAVVLLVAYIGMLVRPVAIGFNYTQKEDGMTISYNFGFKKVKATMSMGDEKETMEAYYFCKDNVVVFDSMGVVKNNEDYKEWTKELKDNWKTYKKTGIEINAFNLEVGNDTYTCVGSIILAVVGGVVTAAVITFATLSTIVVLKKKKA